MGAALMPYRPASPCSYPGCSARVEGTQRCQQHRGKVTVICGLPGVGKSTYVQEAKARGDIVWDFDVMMTALLDLPSRERPEECIGLMLAMRDALVRSLRTNPPDRAAWIIVTKEELATKIARDLGGELVRLGVAETERHMRLGRR